MTTKIHILSDTCGRPLRLRITLGKASDVALGFRLIEVRAARRRSPKRCVISIGSVRNVVCGRAVEHYAGMARMKRWPKMTANWALAMVHSRDGILHSFSERFKIRQSSLVAASSLGKWPRARRARRSFEFSASMALVV